MKKLVVGNWKMRVLRESDAVKLAKTFDAKDAVLCPPFPFLGAVRDVVHKASLGAQDVFWENPSGGGAYTGEVSATMLKSMGVHYVIVGHSERRVIFRETDEMVNKKLLAAVTGGLKVILCVGEPLSVRKNGVSAAKRFVASQLKTNLKSFYPKTSVFHSVIIAYEPLWAIGTGKADNPLETVEMSRFIKEHLQSQFSTFQVPVLYGGSVTSRNVLRMIQYREIGGVLVGGASVNPKEFKTIIKVAHMYSS